MAVIKANTNSCDARNFLFFFRLCACKTRFLFRPPEKELPARRAATNLYQSYSVASMQQFPAGSRQFPAAFCRRYDLMVRSNMSVHQHQDTSSKHEDIRVHPFVCALCLVPSSMLRTSTKVSRICALSHTKHCAPRDKHCQENCVATSGTSLCQQVGRESNVPLYETGPAT